MIETLNHTLLKLDIWCNANKITINIKKSKTVFFTTNKTIIDTCELGGKPLEQVDTYKYLGLILDKHLNYNECLEGIIPKINHKIWLLSKIRY